MMSDIAPVTTGSALQIQAPIINAAVNRFSVLISVYQHDDPAYFDDAMRSVTVDQTLPPSEVVLVVDGPVGEALTTVIARWENQTAFHVNVVRSPQNLGLAAALNLGLKHCRHTYVARMDSDDISVPTRFEKQISYLAKHPQIDLLGGWYQQFDRTLENYLTDRKVPQEMSQLVAYSRTRTPFNHVTGIFRRDSLIAVGGYPDIDGYLEDWWVALRLIKYGHTIENLPEYIVKVRGDGDFIGRRGGWKYIKQELRNLNQMRKQDLITPGDFIRNVLVRTPVRLLPLRLRALMYSAIRRVGTNR